MSAPIDPIIRFFGLTEPHGDCLLWVGTVAGTKSKAGYFQASTSSKVNKVRAHRWIYEQLVGPIPEGCEIDHVRDRGCIGSLCVNVLHLEAVTHEENMRRARLTLCRSGRHDLTVPENVRWDSQGRRRGCAVCYSENQKRIGQERYAKNAEAMKAAARENYHRKRAESLAAAEGAG